MRSIARASRTSLQDASRDRENAETGDAEQRRAREFQASIQLLTANTETGPSERNGVPGIHCGGTVEVFNRLTPFRPKFRLLTLASGVGLQCRTNSNHFCRSAIAPRLSCPTM